MELPSIPIRGADGKTSVESVGDLLARCAGVSMPYGSALLYLVRHLQSVVRSKASQRALYACCGLSPLPDVAVAEARAEAAARLALALSLPRAGEASADPRLDGTFSASASGSEGMADLCAFLGLPLLHGYVPPPASAAARLLGGRSASEAWAFLAGAEGGSAAAAAEPEAFAECAAWAAANLPSRGSHGLQRTAAAAAALPPATPTGLLRMGREGGWTGTFALMLSEERFWVVCRSTQGALLQLCTDEPTGDEDEPRFRMLRVVGGAVRVALHLSASFDRIESGRPASAAQLEQTLLAVLAAKARGRWGGGEEEEEEEEGEEEEEEEEARGRGRSSGSGRGSGSGGGGSGGGSQQLQWACAACTLLNPSSRARCSVCGEARGTAALSAAAASPLRAPAPAPADPPSLPLQAAAAAAPGAAPALQRSASANASASASGGGGEAAPSADSTPSLLAGLQVVSSWHAERAKRLQHNGLASAVLKEICRLPDAAARDVRLTQEEARLLLQPMKRVFTL
jgi:hypothetical protein